MVVNLTDSTRMRATGSGFGRKHEYNMPELL